MMRNFKIHAGFVLALFLVVLWAPPAISKDTKPQNIILFIGDGMGGTAARYVPEAYLGAKKNPDIPNVVRLSMNNMPVVGLTTTFSCESPVTESAGAATAMATGVKSKQIAIGVDPQGNPVTSITEDALKAGMKVGIVSDVSLDHATPSAFCAHCDNRRAYYEIAKDMSQSGVNLFMGGGWVDPEGKKAKEPGKSIPMLFKEAGYTISNTTEAFNSLKKGDDKILWQHPRLHDGQAMRYAMDSDPTDIRLPQITAKSIELLENPKGFFLMIESGKVDWAGHANDTAAYVHDILQYDQAVKVALDYARQNKDTLVIVTEDHGCGGLTMGNRFVGYDGWYERIDWQKHSYVVAQEKLAEFKKANPKATFKDILPFLKENWNLVPATPEFLAEMKKIEGKSVKWQQSSKIFELAGNMLLPFEEEELRIAFASSMEKPPASLLQFRRDAGIYDPFVMAANSIVSRHAGVAWATWGHTSDPAITTAEGPGQHLFSGYYDNTDIYKQMMHLLDLPLP